MGDEDETVHPNNCNRHSQSSGPSSTPSLQLTQCQTIFHIALMFACVSLANLPLYTLYALQTSLNGVLGSITTALQFVLTATAAVFTNAIQEAFGLKATLVLSVWIGGLYVAGYFYPTWPTLVISNVLLGLAAGPVLTVPSVYANYLAQSLAKSRDQDPKNWISALQGIITIGAVYSGAVLGNGMSSVVILLTQHSDGFNTTNHTTGLNGTDSLHSFFNASDGTSNASTGDAAALCQTDQAIYTLPDLSYYLLVSLTAVAAISAGLLSFGVVSVPGQTLALKKLASVKLLHAMKETLLDVIKAATKLRFLAIWPLVVYSGLENGYGASFYTKFFVSDCIGVGYVGAVITLRFLALVVSSIIGGVVIGRIPRWLSSSFNLLLSLSLQLAMLFWAKEPKFVPIFVLAAGLGVSTGLWSQWLAGYLGELGKGSEESAFGLFWTFRLFGNGFVFLLSSFVTDFEAVVFLMAFLLVAFVLLLVMEMVLDVKVYHNASHTEVYELK